MATRDSGQVFVVRLPHGFREEYYALGPPDLCYVFDGECLFKGDCENCTELEGYFKANEKFVNDPDSAIDPVTVIG